MTDAFEDYCWRDVVPAEVLEIYSHYRRSLGIGPAPALLGDRSLRARLSGRNPAGARAASTLSEFLRRACVRGDRADPAAFRRRAPRRPARVLFHHGHARRGQAPATVTATRRQRVQTAPELYAIRPEFRPEPGDVVIAKQRASAFYGTPLAAHLTQLGVRTAIVCGESTSGCVRATAVDAFSHGFHVVLVEECCFDRSPLSHKINLFDLHHKYGDVLHLDAVWPSSSGLAPRKAG